MSKPSVKTFRRARVAAALQLLHGTGADENWLSPLELRAAQYLKRTWQQVDVLACRRSDFTPNARSRIALYPLHRSSSLESFAQ